MGKKKLTKKQKRNLLIGTAALGTSMAVGYGASKYRKRKYKKAQTKDFKQLKTKVKRNISQDKHDTAFLKKLKDEAKIKKIQRELSLKRTRELKQKKLDLAYKRSQGRAKKTKKLNILQKFNKAVKPKRKPKKTIKPRIQRKLTYGEKHGIVQDPKYRAKSSFKKPGNIYTKIRQIKGTKSSNIAAKKILGGTIKNSWQQHITEFRKKHPNLSFKEILKQASKTYKK